VFRIAADLAPIGYASAFLWRAEGALHAGYELETPRRTTQRSSRPLRANAVTR
jgi:hypothetical protein